MAQHHVSGRVRDIPTRLQSLLPWLYLLSIGGLNLFICGGLFHIEYTPWMNSMHGVWIGMARLAADQWFHPGWWPYWYGGQPFEFTYSPLIPAATAVFARIAGCTPALAFHAVSALVYGLAPLTLFVMAWRMTRAPGFSFVAAMAYSLLSLTELLVPDQNQGPAGIVLARRLYIAVVWDDVPHIAATAMLPMVMLFLYLSLRTRKPVYYLLTGLFMTLAVLANAFGMVMVVMVAFCVLLAVKDRFRSNLVITLSIGAAAYLVASPFLPPSLIRTMRVNGASTGDGVWGWKESAAAVMVFGGALLVWRLTARFRASAATQCFAIFTWITGSIPVIAAYAHLRFLPQPERYRVELEMALPLLLVFSARPLVERCPTWCRVCAALLLLAFAGEQVVRYRGYAREYIQSIDIHRTLEYRVAKWVEEKFRGQRVMLGGSLGQWLGAFSDMDQLSGGAFTTSPNFTHLIAMYTIYKGQNTGDHDAQISLVWLKAFGVQAVAMSGPKSQEYWKPYTNPRKFDGVLPVLWQENDTTSYAVPQRSASLAHVIPANRLVKRRPLDGLDIKEVEDYVAALEDPALPLAEMRWEGVNRAVIRTSAGQDQAVSVQINYHPGWHARANGSERPLRSDGLGLTVVDAGCNGTCTIELTYDGGWELRLCRALSMATLAAAVLAGLASLKRGQTPFRNV